MAGEFGREYVADILKRVDDRIDYVVRGIGETLGDLPYGMKRPTSAEVVEMYRARVAESPPEMLLMPDGTVFTESPWVMCVRMLAEGGTEFLRQYRAALRRQPMEEIDDVSS